MNATSDIALVYYISSISLTEEISHPRAALNFTMEKNA